LCIGGSILTGNFFEVLVMLITGAIAETVGVRAQAVINRPFSQILRVFGTDVDVESR
jgi:hypothetical protein